MSYKVLARKWRPGSFNEVVGQQHILQSLAHALDSDRLHHALLFTGTRGVGKTTIARILAKALNCEQGIGSNPCGQCENCLAVDEGRFIDLIEVDAASKTGVDDMRELLDNVQYLPSVGRFKVYLIDEVHMLSKSSFNALLKTLEEPPDHVKFLLATTDPQKLPVTVLSRCLQFNLKRLDPAQIKSQLVSILETEKIEGDDEALDLLAACADGSMRDALSLLDQAIAFGSGSVQAKDVRKMLGSIEQTYIHALVESLANDDTEALFRAIDDAADRSPDFMMVLNELLASFYHLSLVQLAPAIIEQRSLDMPWLQEFSEKFSPEQLQLYYQICLTGKKDLPLAPDSRSGFEMLMLRMLAFRPATGPQSSVKIEPQPVQKPAQKAQHEQQTTTQAATSIRQDKASYAASAGSTEPVASPQPQAAGNAIATAPAEVDRAGDAVEAKTAESKATGNRDWSALVAGLSITGLTKQLALHMAPAAWDDTVLELLIDVEHETIYSAAREQELVEALQKELGEKVKISTRIDNPVTETPAKQKQRLAQEQQQAAEQSIDSDPAVNKLVEEFGASVSRASIRPVN